MVIASGGIPGRVVLARVGQCWAEQHSGGN
jgi:hypothetical protein